METGYEVLHLEKTGVYEKTDVSFNKKTINWIRALYLISIASGPGGSVSPISVASSFIIG